MEGGPRPDLTLRSMPERMEPLALTCSVSCVATVSRFSEMASFAFLRLLEAPS